MSPDQSQNNEQAGNLQKLQSFRQHFHEGVDQGLAEAPVTYAQMAAVLDEITALFKTTGVGTRRNSIGTPMPPKRSWEAHG